MKPPRAALFVLAWVALLAALLPTPWKQVDWWFYSLLPRSAVPVLDARIALIDVDRPPSLGLADFRSRLAEHLDALAAGSHGLPDAVLLDVQIDAPIEGLAPLQQAIRTLQQRGVKVYAAVNPQQPNSDALDPQFMKNHAAALYTGVLDGFGHTRFGELGGNAKFDTYLDMGHGVELPALAVRVAVDRFGRRADLAAAPLLLQIGAAGDMPRATWRLQQGRFVPVAAGGAAADFARRIVIVGSPRQDHAWAAGRNGPELLAWALSARIANADDPSAVQVFVQPWLLAVLVPLFAALASFVTWWVHLRSPRLRRSFSWAAPLAGTAAAALGLGAVVVLLLAVRQLYPQWALVLAGAALASVLTWVHVRRQWRAAVALLQGIEGAQGMDVFISYSRTPPDNGEWVRTQVAEPLQRGLKRPDGSAARVFFDRSSIQPGEYWHERVAADVDNAYVCVAVYSDHYFGKPVCRYELAHALGKHVTERGVIVPVARITQGIPPQYANINYLDASAGQPVGDALVARVQALLDTQAARSSAGR